MASLLEVSLAEDADAPILTPRLHLRRMSRRDTDAVVRLRNDPKVFSWRTPDTPKEAVKWLEDRLRDPSSLIYMIELLNQEGSQDNNVVIGNVGAGQVPEVGYVLDPAHWNKGYATEALKAFIDFYWKSFPDGHPLLAGKEERHALRAETGPEAVASRGVLKKCGFIWEKQREVIEDGEIVMLDCWVAPKPYK